GGTLWGANAVNGVISVVTRSAADSQGLYATAATGTQLGVMAGVRHGTELAPGLHLRLFARHVDHDEGVRTDGAPGADAGHRTQAGFRLDRALPRGAFTLQGDFHDTREQDLELPDETTVLRGANL